jgi:hypothetical protein
MHRPYVLTSRHQRCFTLPTLPTEGAGEAAREDPGDWSSWYNGRAPRESTELVGENASTRSGLGEKSESRMGSMDDRARGDETGGRDIWREKRSG